MDDSTEMRNLCLSNENSRLKSSGPMDTRDNTLPQPTGKQEGIDDGDTVNVGGTTPFQTFLSLFKGNVGSGCMCLPWSFSILGIPLGCLTVIVVAFLVTFNGWTLVRLKRKHLCGKRSATYTDLGEVAYGYGFRSVVDFSVITLQMAVCTIYFSLISVNLASFFREIFNLSSVDDTNTDQSYQSNEGTRPLINFLAKEQVVMTLFVLPVCLGLSSLPNLKVLSPVIGVATFLMFFTFFLISAAINIHWNEGFASWKQEGGIDTNWAKFPIATCAIMYSLEGDQLILPIEAAMEKPVKYFKRTLVFSFSFICCLFCIFGSCCVIAFGQIKNGSITADLQDRAVELDSRMDSGFPFSTSQLVFLANLIVSFAILFTYPLQLYPILGLTGQILSNLQRKRDTTDTNNIETPVNISDLPNYGSAESSHITPYCEFNDNPDVKIVDNTIKQSSTEKVEDDGMIIECDSLKMRFSLVFMTYIMAMVVPHLELLISLGGALTGSLTSIILPPLIALKFEIDDATSVLKYPERGSKKEFFRALVDSSNAIWILFFSFLILLGIVYGIIGTWYSLRDLIESL